MIYIVDIPFTAAAQEKHNAMKYISVVRDIWLNIRQIMHINCVSAFTNSYALKATALATFYFSLFCN